MNKNEYPQPFAYHTTHYIGYALFQEAIKFLWLIIYKPIIIIINRYSYFGILAKTLSRSILYFERTISGLYLYYLLFHLTHLSIIFEKIIIIIIILFFLISLLILLPC